MTDLAQLLTSREAWVRRAVWVVLVFGLTACVLRGADNPADPSFAPTAGGDPAAAGRRPLEGFEEIVIRITSADGTTLDWCALLAATEMARQQGMQGQRDFRGYDAMVFRFDEPHSGRFWMYKTLLPLSIGWFAADGTYLSGTQMDPCPSDDSDECPRYGPDPPSAYLHAVEAPQGRLGALGIGPGARLSFPAGQCA